MAHSHGTVPPPPTRAGRPAPRAGADGQREEPDVGRRPAHLLDHRLAAPASQVHVEKDDLWEPLDDHLHRGEDLVRLADHLHGLTDLGTHARSEEMVVVDEEDPRRVPVFARIARSSRSLSSAGPTSDLPPLAPAATPASVPDYRRRRRSGLWMALGAVLVLAALAHGPMWWPWWTAVRIPWLVLAGIAFVLWRRSRRRRWRAGAS